MGRSSEAWQEQQDQENESGIDMHDCYHYHHPLEKLNTKGNQNERIDNSIGSIGNGENNKSAESKCRFNPANSGGKEAASVPF